MADSSSDNLRGPEVCIGCGGTSGQHPWVGIGARVDVIGEPIAEREEWAGFPVCDACHRDPARRKQRLKVHFFSRAEALRALKAAGSSDSLGG